MASHSTNDSSRSFVISGKSKVTERKQAAPKNGELEKTDKITSGLGLPIQKCIFLLHSRVRCHSESTFS